MFADIIPDNYRLLLPLCYVAIVLRSDDENLGFWPDDRSSEHLVQYQAEAISMLFLCSGCG